MSGLGRRHFVAIAVAAAVACALLLYPSKRIGRNERLATPSKMSATAKGVLEKRMQRHGEALTGLMDRVVLFDYASIHAQVERILGEPPLSRPLTGDASELNSLLPARFFELQDELRLRAREVDHAAQSANADKLLDATVALTRTCMACHHLYLEGSQ